MLIEKLEMCCEQTVAGVWTTKSEEVLKSQGSSSSSFPTKMTSRAEAKHLFYDWNVSNVWKVVGIEMFEKNCKVLLQVFFLMF